jgi:predicted Fe-Mo cluster-binding NifX family protein
LKREHLLFIGNSLSGGKRKGFSIIHYFTKGGQNMRNKIRTYCLLVLFSALILQLQPNLASAANSDTDHTKSFPQIAVAAAGDSTTSEISMMAGKAPYYLIFDKNGAFLKSIKNPGQWSGRNSSSVVVDLLLQESCKIVIAGNFGRKLQHQLEAHKIEYYEREGIVKNVVQTFVAADKTPRQTH